jgi:hypothetical protein
MYLSEKVAPKERRLDEEKRKKKLSDKEARISGAASKVWGFTWKRTSKIIHGSEKSSLFPPKSEIKTIVHLHLRVNYAVRPVQSKCYSSFHWIFLYFDQEIK